MRVSQLLVRGLGYYWRTNAAVIGGVATAVAVLAGALLVGDSVRGSLRDLVLARLGRTTHVVAAAGFVRESLATGLAGQGTLAAAPVIALPGLATAQESGRRVGGVQVYGVDERFWTFHGTPPQGPADREALVSQALARELRLEVGQAVLVRVQRPSDLPLESVHGRKDDLGRTLRLTVSGVANAASMGDFALEPRQGDVRTVFVPLARLQQELGVTGRVNLVLLQAPAEPGVLASIEQTVRGVASVEDLDLTIRPLVDRGVVSVGSRAGFVTDPLAAAAVEAGERADMIARPLLTYLANSFRHGDREVPYSLVTAIDLAAITPAVEAAADGGAPPIVLNEWAAAELQATVGDPLTIEYYLWEEPGQLVTRTADFRIAGVVPVGAGDRDLGPEYSGITDAPTLAEWDPPFPIDLRRVRPADEAYWERYRTTPKAFIPLDVGQRLWRSRYGAITSVRFTPPAGQTLEEARGRYATELRAAADPLALGIAVRDVRGDGLASSRGATDFGLYFVSFSFFLVVSALVLAALFFKLGIEQRAQEVGVLRAVGFDAAGVRRLFLQEGLLLAVIGAVLGVAGAVAYAGLLVRGLGTWWIDAVGTSALALHVTTRSLAIGAAGGIAAAAACIAWTIRGLSHVSERALLMGQIEPPATAEQRGPSRRLAAASAILAIAGAGGLASPAIGVAPAAAFFGAGSMLLVSALCLFGLAFRRVPARALAGSGWRGVTRLGARAATYRPGRSVLSVAVVASATFILISVDAFRREEVTVSADRRSGLGGYPLLVETLLPVVHDPNSTEGRDALGLFGLDNVRFEPFRRLAGDDASCLNLYEPRSPTILAPRDSFLQEGRFAFQDSLATTDEERANPWLLLARRHDDGAVPVIADANSMTYVLHKRLGEDVVIVRGGREVRLRVVAALRDSIFQGELLMSQTNFMALFPEQQGSQVLLVDAPADRADTLAAEIEAAMVDYGGDAVGTAERLASFHRVENTYLSTFQLLGALGLLLGTVGVGAVLLRNALERRRELALLQAVGYRRGDFLLMAATENTLVLMGGVLAGAACAALAIAPAMAERGGRLPLSSGGILLLFAVVVVGLLSTLVATRAALSGPLLDALRSE
jgi:ABC-type lipoprotein release transport system permease subunit